MSLVYGKLRVGVDGGIFCLRDGSYYYGYEGRVAQYRCIEGIVVGVSKEMETTGDTPRFGAGEIGSVGVYTE
jgi:hypothetical protein